jgi:divalent metal cation (Fe/Co/Zn/Cd) transporter
MIEFTRLTRLLWFPQIYATVKSGSIAIAASTLDSLLDLMAGGILWFTHLSMKSINVYRYPIGKLRVQPVGIIIFAAVMATLGMLYVCRKGIYKFESCPFFIPYSIQTR